MKRFSHADALFLRGMAESFVNVARDTMEDITMRAAIRNADRCTEIAEKIDEVLYGPPAVHSETPTPTEGDDKCS